MLCGNTRHFVTVFHIMSYGPCLRFPVKQSHYRPVTDPEGSRRLRLQEFLENRRMKVVRLSALRTGRLYPLPGLTPNTRFY